jgi:hypothetical protein
VPAAIWPAIGYWLLAALILGYRKITNLCHCLLCSVVVLVIVPHNRRSTKITILVRHEKYYFDRHYKRETVKMRLNAPRLLASPGVFLFSDVFAMPVPGLRTSRPNYGRAIISVQPLSPVPLLRAIWLDYSWAILAVKLTMLIPPLGTIWQNPGWPIIPVPFVMLAPDLLATRSNHSRTIIAM